MKFLVLNFLFVEDEPGMSFGSGTDCPQASHSCCYRQIFTLSNTRFYVIDFLIYVQYIWHEVLQFSICSYSKIILKNSCTLITWVLPNKDRQCWVEKFPKLYGVNRDRNRAQAFVSMSRNEDAKFRSTSNYHDTQAESTNYFLFVLLT